MWVARDLTIGTVSVRGGSGDTPALRAAMSGQLQAVDLRPPGLPPSALLIVRHLSDPLPGRLAGRPGATLPDTRWRQAARQKMAELYRHAASPSTGPIPADARAVLFRDEAEMLAHLALDLSRANYRSRWWWHTILRRLATTDLTLPAVLCRQARRLPAIVWHLRALGRLPEVAAALDAKDAATTLRALVSAQQLSLESFLPPTSARDTRPVVDAADRLDQRSRRQADQRITDSVEPPWRAWLPDLALQSMPREVECLFGSALALHHRPGRVRDRLFAQSVRRWWATPRPAGGAADRGGLGSDLAPRRFAVSQRRSEGQEQAKSSLVGKDGNRGGVEGSVPLSGDPSSSRTHQSLDQRSISHGQPESTPPRHRELQGVASGTANDGVDEVPGQPNAEAPSTLDSGLKSTERRRIADELPTTEAPRGSEIGPIKPPSDIATTDAVRELSTPEFPEPGPSFEHGVATRLGGVLYLINLIRHLDLPDSFEADWKLASRLGPWGLLEVLGRILLGLSSGDELAGDPIWAALAEIDGRRPGRLPGAGVVACDSFRLPLPWFEGVVESTEFSWAASRDRLWLWAGDGVLLATCPRRELAPSGQARAELNPYIAGLESFTPRRRRLAAVPLGMVDALISAGLDPHLGNWLAWAVPSIRRRLELACGESSVEALLRCPGRLYVTGSHVDLVIDLSRVSLAARVAGLDRDPGWLPAFGRVVKFHYE